MLARCDVKLVKLMSGRLRRVCGVWLALRVCRPEAAFWAGLVGLDVVILKADHLHPEPVGVDERDPVEG